MENVSDKALLEGIAVIGMSGRFPGSNNIDEFWKNLMDGKECITYFSKEDAKACEIDDESLNDPNYVFAGGILNDIEMFDANFFGLNPKEAENMDPQQRLFLECTHEALEDAGYSRNSYDYPIGVYSGCNMSYYFLYHLFAKLGIKDDLAVAVGNDKDYLATRTSYLFNLKGPSINVQTACSTSMTAIALAYESLIDYNCDMAIAGGAGIKLPQKSGYLFQTGFIGSPDGRTRPFDQNANGTVFTSAVGVLIMKRLEDAVRDGDNIYAVIKGMSVNNDGSAKVGFTAPSREGQAEVISNALSIAGVNPEDISYIETHGTGTSLGDPIEISALNMVFEQATKKKSYCAIGSVKSNIGHAISGAGISGMIKTLLALKYKQIPPSINFESPNSKIDFSNSPFYVNTKLSDWECGSSKRIAGVSSFGFGGTNVHAVLEEAPSLKSSLSGRHWQLLTLSAKSAEVLDRMCNNLAYYLQNNPLVNFADVAYTLHTGRKEYEFRRAIVCKNADEAVNLLKVPDGENAYSGTSQGSTLEYIKDESSAFADNLEAVQLLAEQWIKGLPVDWDTYHTGEKRFKVSLPTYPFDRRKYWVPQFKMDDINKPKKTARYSSDINDWLYVPSWESSLFNSIEKVAIDTDGFWLAFLDDTGFGNKVVHTLKSYKANIITVLKADRFQRLDDYSYAVNPSEKQNYIELLESLSQNSIKIKNIVHFWNVTLNADNIPLPELSAECWEQGFLSLSYLAQALGDRDDGEFIRVGVISNNLYSASGMEKVQPEKALITGPVKVIPREYPGISCQSIDVVLPEKDELEQNRLANQVIRELACKNPDFVVALRGTKRWIQKFEKANYLHGEENEIIKNGGVYLITGGLGGIGTALAKHLSEKANIKLVLIRRSIFPDKNEWQNWLDSHNSNDRTSIKIRQLLEIENTGSEIMTANVDICDNREMTELIEKVNVKFGGLNGIIHAAGITDNGLIQDKDAETAKKVLAPKVTGTIVLNELLKDKKLDFIVLFSSSSAILGNAGFVDYCSANCFLDAYSYYKNSVSDTYTVAINWDEWDEVGMAVDNKDVDRVKNKISVANGLKLFDKIMSSRVYNHVIVSPGDFTGMMDSIRDFLSAPFRGIKDSSQNQVGYNRPQLDVPYTPPVSETEKTIAEIWQQLLGIQPVGVSDDFFDLGGDSLTATTMIAKLAKLFTKRISLQTIFENSTVSKLACAVNDVNTCYQPDEEYEVGEI